MTRDPVQVAGLAAGGDAGAAVSNLRDVLAGGGSCGLGRIGFLAANAGARDWSRPVLVSNHHVLWAHGASAGDAVYRPEFTVTAAGLRFERGRLHRVAVLEGEGFEGHHRFAWPGEPEEEYFVDGAAARLIGGPPLDAAPGPALFRRVARAHRFDAVAGRELRVRKLGVDARPTGRVVDVAATVRGEDGRPCRNTMVVRTLAGAAEPFAGEGDSGALVVDEQGRAVGLLWGVDRNDPGVAYACHLQPLLDRLGLVPWKRGWPSVPACDEEEWR